MPPAIPSLRRMRAVVVDDQPEQREMVEFMLLARGFDVAGTAADGNDALRVIAATDPDIVVSDYQMPIVDGLDMVRALRDEPGRAILPVVILTGSSDAGVDVLRDMPHVAVLAKPVDVGALVDAVDRLLVDTTTAAAAGAVATPALTPAR